MFVTGHSTVPMPFISRPEAMPLMVLGYGNGSILVKSELSWDMVVLAPVSNTMGLESESKLNVFFQIHLYFLG